MDQILKNLDVAKASIIDHISAKFLKDSATVITFIPLTYKRACKS